MDLKNIKLIIEKDTECSEAIKCFIDKAEKVFAFPELDENDLRQKLWTSLSNLAASSSDELLKANCFSALRILGREKKSLDSLVAESTLLPLIKKFSGLDDQQFIFTEKNKIVAIEAEKCLCNLVFNSMKVAKECCKNGILQSIINRMNMYKEPLFPLEIKFFDVKLIFIITALCPEIRKPLADDEYTVRYLIDILGNIVMKSYGDHHGKTATLNNEVVELASEILKALFNLTLRIQSSESELTKYTDLVSILRKCLLASVDAKDKRVTLHNNVINLLTNIPNPCYKALIPPIDADKTEDQLEYKSHDVAALSQILELLKTKMLNDGSVSDQHEILSPITTVLYKGACADRIIRKYLRSEILPPLKDVHSRPEEGSTLRNCLCRLLTTPMTQLRDIIAELLFVLCKKSVRRMIKYTGYGNAAGLFAQRGLLGGREDDGAADFSSDSEDSETEEYAEHKHMINPVLGCYEPPHADAMAEMSDEQKEFEAMKLVQLMDDLMKSGTIKPCRVGKDGKPEPIEHVLQLQESIKGQTNWRQDNCDSD